MGYTNKHPKYTYQKNSFYYFSRAVPSDLREHYATSRLVIGLRTKSSHKAALASKNIASKLDDFWLGLRLKEASVPARNKLVESPTEICTSDAPTLLEAQENYLMTKGVDRRPLFFSHTKRAIRYAINHIGNKQIDQYNGLDAASFRDHLRGRGLSISSAKRNISCVKAVINFNINELGVGCKNAFGSVYFQKEERLNKRTIDISVVRKIQISSLGKSDQLRLLIALISDTGMRLGEAVGLKKEDIFLGGDFPYLDIKKNELRSLKTTTSTRAVPLVGVSLKAAKLLRNMTPGEYCFPKYIGNGCCKSNSASAAANKWLKIIGGEGVVVHGLRHSFRDRLRGVETPTEVIDQLGGWSAGTVGQGYGDGYKMDLLYKYMNLIEL